MNSKHVTISHVRRKSITNPKFVFFPGTDFSVNHYSDHRPRWFSLISCLAVVVLSATTASATNVNHLRLGIQGQGKVGRWLPVSIRADELPADVTVELQVAFPDPRGDICVQTVDTGTTSAGGTISLNGYFRCGRIAGIGTVALVSDDETLSRSNVVFGESVAVFDDEVDIQSSLDLQQLNVISLVTFGAVEGIPELLRNAASYAASSAELRHYNLADVSALPRDSRGLDSVDKILLTDSFDFDPEQSAALIQWVRDGGELFISTGGSVPEFLASPVGQWATGYFDVAETPIEMRRFSSLEAFIPGASRIQTSLRGKNSWPVAAVRSSQNAVIVDSLDGPIISRQSAGGGVVTLVGVDLNQIPFRRWTSLPQFYEVLFFGKKLDSPRSQKSGTSRISQSGVSDLATQLLSTVDAQPETGRWSTWSVMGMLVLWLLLIGPLDYVIVTRALKRPELTWITFPTLIIIGALSVFLLAGQSSKLQLRQFHVVDISAEDGHQHVTSRSWMSVSSPESLKTTCSATPAFLSSGLAGDTGLTLSWSGRAEDVFGAMYRQGGIGLGRQTYRHRNAAPAELSGVPFLTNGSRGFEAKWHDVADKQLATSKLFVSGFGILEGTFTHHLPCGVRRWVVVHGNRVYQSTSAEHQVLAAGEVWDSDVPHIMSADLKGFLNASHIVQTSHDGNSKQSQFSKQRSTQMISAYDTKSVDEMYIMMMISFYEFAGGSDYAGLSHTQFRNLELSDTIRLNHAVLIGFVDEPAATLTLNNKVVEPANSATIVRVFLPVDRRPAGELAKTKEDIESASENRNN